MDSLKQFFFTQENFKIQKRLGEDRIMDSLILFKYIFLRLWFYMNLLNDFSQIRKFENSKKARRR